MMRLVLFLVALTSCSHVQKATIDVGADFSQGFYQSAGVSYPVGPIWASAGLWGGWTFGGERAWGPYLTLGYSWSLEGISNARRTKQ